MIDLAEFPSGERIAKGIGDLGGPEVTVEALLVAIASCRLGDLGLPIPSQNLLPRDPEIALYDLLCTLEEDPFFSYRALLDGLDSFVSSFESVARA